MRIFNEIKNMYFVLLCKMIQKIYENKSITKKEFERFFLDNTRNDPNCVKIARDLLEPEKCGIFTVNSSDQTVSLSIDSRITIMPSEAEQIWLLSVLALDETNIFLNENEKTKLSEILGKSNRPIPQDFFESFPKCGYSDKIDPEFIDKTRIILKAIHSGKLLKYSYKSRDGKEFLDKTTVPFKIEYSVRERVFRLCHFPESDRRPVKSNISGMFDLSLRGYKTDSRSIDEMVRERLLPDPLVFTVFNSHNAIERAKILFSTYPRTISDNVSEDGNLLSVEFNIEYYTFQERELISDILSFGPRIKVTSPRYVINKIVETIRRQQQ